MLTEEGISLHAHKALDVRNHNLNNHIVVGFVRELAVVKPSEEGASLAGVVALLLSN